MIDEMRSIWKINYNNVTEDNIDALARSMDSMGTIKKTQQQRTDHSADHPFTEAPAIKQSSGVGRMFT